MELAFFFSRVTIYPPRNCEFGRECLRFNTNRHSKYSVLLLQPYPAACVRARVGWRLGTLRLLMPFEACHVRRGIGLRTRIAVSTASVLVDAPDIHRVGQEAQVPRVCLKFWLHPEYYIRAEPVAGLCKRSVWFRRLVRCGIHEIISHTSADNGVTAWRTCMSARFGFGRIWRP
jgi:hypothetical protein